MQVLELVKRYGMKPHEENGSYSEQHYPYEGSTRAPSGCSYFYTAPGEWTKFHRIDCDEYWCYTMGDPLEVWIIDADAHLTIRRLGTQDGADPVIYFPKGAVFASRSLRPSGEGTFFACITVPRFDYRGFELWEKETVVSICPEAGAFWERGENIKA